MNITRRDFVTHTTIGALALATGGMEACSASDIFAMIQSWEPAGKAAFQGIVTLLEAAGLVNPIIAPLITTILTGFDDLLADIKAYRAMTPPPVGALAKIVAIFNLIVSNFQFLLANLTSNPIFALITGLAQIILSTIAGFLNQLPPTAGAMQLGTTFKVGQATVTFIPKNRSVKQFKKDYNSVANANGHPEIDLKLSLLEHF